MSVCREQPQLQSVIGIPSADRTISNAYNERLLVCTSVRSMYSESETGGGGQICWSKSAYKHGLSLSHLTMLRRACLLRLFELRDKPER